MTNVGTPMANGLYIDDFSTALWFQTGENGILIIFDYGPNEKDEYDGEITYSEDGVLFNKASISENFMVIPYDEDDCFLFLDKRREITKPKIVAQHWRHGRREYVRYEK